MEFAQPLDGGRAAVVTRSVEETAARLGADRRAYRRLFGPLARHMDEILPDLLAPLRRIPAHPLAMASYGRRAILPAATVVRTWRTPEARAVMAGAAAHAMMPLTAVPTAGIGIMLVSLAHAVGWPVVAGGSARITDAMAEAVVEAGGTIETGHWVRSLAELPPASATLLDVSPRALVSLAGDRLPVPVPRRAAPVPLRRRGLQGGLRAVRPGALDERGLPPGRHAAPGRDVRADGGRRGRGRRGQAPASTPTCSWSSRASPIRPAPRPAGRRCGPTATSPPGPTWT